MPNWNEVGSEIQAAQLAAKQIYDSVRRRYLDELHKLTGRNVILYYSGWLHAFGPVPPDVAAINDNDIVGFMSACHGLDRDKGLDLILHTPGGDLAATKAIVAYLQKMFDDIRVVVPQIAMSAGTMIACSGRAVVMGKQSSLGPIDPQLNGMPAHGIIEEFDTAHDEMRKDPSRAMVWQPIIAKYPPTLIGRCRKAIQLSEDTVRDWLESGMLSSEDDPKAAAETVVRGLGDTSKTLLHERHISAEECRKIGLKIELMEEDDDLQDKVLTVHHACMHTLSSTGTLKIIENHQGKAYNVSVSPQPGN